MRYPTRRYANPNELRYYAMRYPNEKALAKHLRRSVRSVHDWLTERKKIPWWVPEILRLQQMEHDAMMYQMNMRPVRQRLGIATHDAELVPFTPKEKPRQEPGRILPLEAETTEQRRSA